MTKLLNHTPPVAGGVYVSRICNQESIGISSLEKIAGALGMKVSELVALGEDKA